MNKLLKVFLPIIIVVLLVCFVKDSLAEDEPTVLYVMTKSLNGRIRPGKKYQTLVEFELGTPLTPTGRWSRDHMWVEVVTTENDYVWCNVNYLTERKEVIHVYSLGDSRIKIRKAPGYGKVTGYAHREEVLEITNVVMGYGKCEKGWVDLSYFIEDYE